MKRRRTIAAAPIRTADEAWEIVCQLLTATLERSPAIPAGSVTTALFPLRGLAPALIAAGHLESNGLVLIDVDIHVSIFIMTADAALTVDENLNPVPGGAGATANWMLHLPPVAPLGPVLTAAVKDSPHLSTAPPPTSAPIAKAAARAGESPIDLEALRSAETNR